MRYIPHTEADLREMLSTIGVERVDDLFAVIPPALRVDGPLDLPEALCEHELLAHVAQLAGQNRTDGVSFLGGGVYRHYVPTAIDQILLRGELYTAYTPYQPEIAQGTLQIIFEFQTMIAELLAMDVVNASMYDGSTAVAEAALMASRVKRKKRVLLSAGLHPEYRAVVKTTLSASGVALETVPVDASGSIDLERAAALFEAGDVAGLIVAYPSFFGTFDDVAAAAELAHAHKGAKLGVAFQEALAFGLLEPPGALGADIVAGEGQSLGVPTQFGGPSLGLFAGRTKDVRQLPGRIAGETVDSRGQRGYVLTLATREQHIRRGRATSNICTNVALMATAATIHMALLGPRGLAAVARACHLQAEKTKRAVLAIDGFEPWFTGPTFNEFVVRTPRPAADLVAALAPEGLAPGVDLGRYDDDWGDALLVTATELTTDDDIDRLVEGLRAKV